MKEIKTVRPGMARGRPKSFDRNEALEKAVELFFDVGFQGAGLSDLIEKMGIARQSLYTTFGDKQSLFIEALERYADEEYQMAKGVLQGPGSALENLKAFINMLEMKAGDEHGRGCLIGNAIGEVNSLDEPIREILRNKVNLMESLLFDTIKRAKAEGDLPKSVNASSLARTIICAAQGLVQLSKLNMERDMTADVIRMLHNLLE